MKHYIFTSVQGETIAPNGEPIENLQVVGYAIGNTPHEALEKLQSDMGDLNGFTKLEAHELASDSVTRLEVSYNG